MKEYLLDLENLSVGISLVSVIFLVWEFAWFIWRGKLNKDRLKEMGASFSALIPAAIVDVLLRGALVGLYFWVYKYSLFKFEINWLTVVLTILGVDFIYYWEHRIEHEKRLFWAAYHSVHHSSKHYNEFTAFRVSFIDVFFSPLFFLPLVFIGFHPMIVLVGIGIVVGYQSWIHTEMVGKLGFFDKVFNSPSNHRVHHGSDPKYLDKNYGGILIIWDRIFGTYQAEEERPTYGLTTPLDSSHPLKVHFHDLQKLCRDLQQARSGREIWGHLFKHPGWQAPRDPQA